MEKLKKLFCKHKVEIVRKVGICGVSGCIDCQGCKKVCLKCGKIFKI